MLYTKLIRFVMFLGRREKINREVLLYFAQFRLDSLRAISNGVRRSTKTVRTEFVDHGRHSEGDADQQHARDEQQTGRDDNRPSRPLRQIVRMQSGHGVWSRPVVLVVAESRPAAFLLRPGRLPVVWRGLGVSPVFFRHTGSGPANARNVNYRPTVNKPVTSDRRVYVRPYFPYGR